MIVEALLLIVALLICVILVLLMGMDSLHKNQCELRDTLQEIKEKIDEDY